MEVTESFEKKLTSTAAACFCKKMSFGVLYSSFSAHDAGIVSEKPDCPVPGSGSGRTFVADCAVTDCSDTIKSKKPVKARSTNCIFALHCLCITRCMKIESVDKIRADIRLKNRRARAHEKIIRMKRNNTKSFKEHKNIVYLQIGKI